MNIFDSTSFADDLEVPVNVKVSKSKKGKKALNKSNVFKKEEKSLSLTKNEKIIEKDTSLPTEQNEILSSNYLSDSDCSDINEVNSFQTFRQLTLFDLPNDCISEFSNFFSPSELISLLLTCKDFYTLFMTPSFYCCEKVMFKLQKSFDICIPKVQLPYVRYLSIHENEINENLIIEYVKKFPNLSIVRIFCSEKITIKTFKELGNLRIKRMIFRKNYSIQSECFKYLKYLEELNIVPFGRLKKFDVNYFKNLKILSIGVGGISNRYLSQFKNLQKIHAYMRDMKCICELKNLKHLKLTQCFNFDIKSFCNLKELCTFECVLCKKVSSEMLTSMTSKLRNLRKMKLVKLKLDNLNFLIGSNLDYLCILDCDLMSNYIEKEEYVMDGIRRIEMTSVCCGKFCYYGKGLEIMECRKEGKKKICDYFSCEECK